MLQRKIQQRVYRTPSNKLLYTMSYLKRIYPPNGLTYEKLIENNKSKKSKLLTIYRNLIRAIKYLQFHKYYKSSLILLFKTKIRQDYSYKRSILLDDSKVLNDDELFERLVNTVNFIHNSTLDSINNSDKMSRPKSMEFKILDAIIQFEITKSVPSRTKLNNENITFEKLKLLRDIERSMTLENSSDDLKKEQVWWIDHDLGTFKNSFCFDYLKELKNYKSDSFHSKFIFPLLDFEQSIVLLNEEMKLLL